jgi:hypothetical protein
MFRLTFKYCDTLLSISHFCYVDLKDDRNSCFKNVSKRFLSFIYTVLNMGLGILVISCKNFTIKT